MTQSPEYPDLRWMPPRSWTNANRSSVQLVVIHTTEGSAHSQSAEDGANYDQDRTDGTSTHYFHDCDSTIQCVRTEDQAHAARTQGNKRGIQHELCTKANSANWNDSYHQAMLRLAAKQAARDAKKWDIPIRKLTSAQVADGVKGFCGHVDVTYAFPQDGGTHTDPGKNFPWSQFLAMIEDEGDTMSVADFAEAFKNPDVQAAFRTMLATCMTNPGIKIYNQADDSSPHGTKEWADFIGGAAGTADDRIEKKVVELESKVDALTALIESHVAGLVEGNPGTS